MLVFSYISQVDTHLEIVTKLNTEVQTEHSFSTDLATDDDDLSNQLKSTLKRLKRFVKLPLVIRGGGNHTCYHSK